MAPISKVSSKKKINYLIQDKVQNRQVVIFANSGDHPDIAKIIAIVKAAGGTDIYIDQLNSISDLQELTQIQSDLTQFSGRNELPLIYIRSDPVGGLKELTELSTKGNLLRNWLTTEKFDYDLIVIGGGSGGLAAAKEASNQGKKVALLDFVAPTPFGTSWGLGGTCVNVGCIPKKLMHQAALLGQAVEDAKKFGWEISSEKFNHNWQIMKNNIQDYIKSLNWSYRVTLREKSVEYLNAAGSFIDTHKVKTVDKKNKETVLTSQRFLLATGLRPRYLDIPGAKEYCITSDDLFALPYCPGKTLVVGASYVALECAGFLHGIGLEVTVAVRSILLRGFDQDMAERIGKHMEDIGIKLLRQSIPIKVEKLADGQPGRLLVTLKSETKDAKDKTTSSVFSAEYNTVLLAIGRDATTDTLGLDLVGVKRNPKNKKIYSLNEQTNIPYIYAIGDILEGKPELTPVAIQAGKLWAKRVLGNKSLIQCDYVNVPTTVFTPLEYGCCGLSQEMAVSLYGEENVKIFHNMFIPLEFTIPKRNMQHCYAKLVCRADDDDRVLGLHLLGPNAGEITQGFGISLLLSATKADFDRLIGIHPTCAEVFTGLTLSKGKEEPPQPSGC